MPASSEIKLKVEKKRKKKSKPQQPLIDIDATTVSNDSNKVFANEVIASELNKKGGGRNLFNPNPAIIQPESGGKKLKYKIVISLLASPVAAAAAAAAVAASSSSSEQVFWEAEFICDNPDQVIWFSSMYTGMLYSTLDEHMCLNVRIKPFLL